MPPPRARTFTLEHLAAFDDEALSTFLVPGDWGVDPGRLGTALCAPEHDALAGRVRAALASFARSGFDAGRRSAPNAATLESATRRVVNRLFWALLYWHDPGGYEELIAGERIPRDLLDALPLEGRVVADLGAGAGRFALYAARRARRVIAVDGVPQLLARLEQHAHEQGLTNIETRRGSFLDLPLADTSVDVAVACSSLTSHSPWGGEAALAEARRVVRAGGELVVIWPDDPSWFTARGFTHLSVPGAQAMHFADTETAVRICRDFYSEDAAEWARQHGPLVPFEVLGVPPPTDACIARVGPPGGGAGRRRRPRAGSPRW